MTLTLGTRIGPYEITGAIGAGGMGEVYRGRDTKLNRDVAIKVLPAAFAQDRDRLARFEREAQSLAALNHPNIAQIYGVFDLPPEGGSHPALVMEFADGEDLSTRIAAGAIPWQDALPLAIQIADALAVAHDRGIVHRDLKPANIKLTADGTVKVLDFGLAKALTAEGSDVVQGVSPVSSPTVTSPATQLGVILGTAAYMAPEQAKGKPVDRRADVWAFGGVLFEMLTGKRAFEGEDVTDVIASIMRGEPDWTALPAQTPPAIRKLLRRCLEKDRAKRLDSMAVARHEIQEALAAPEVPPASVVASRRSLALPLLATAVVAAAAAAAATWIAMRAPETTPGVIRVHVTPPPPDALSLDTFASDVDISRDGKWIVYNGRRQGGVPEIFIRRIDETEGKPVPGSGDGRAPAVTPDGQWVVFQSGNSIQRAPVDGGAPQLVCATCAGGFRGIAWLPDGSFVYSTAGGTGGLRRQRLNDAANEFVTRVDREATDRGHLYPYALPGGRGLLFDVEASGNSNIWVLDLRTNKTKLVARGGGTPRYVPTGHLLYASSGALYALNFDLETLEASGTPRPVLDRLVTKSGGGASYGVADTGTLVYVSGDRLESTYNVAVARPKGVTETVPVPSGNYVMGRWSPDGTKIVLDSRAGDSDIWVWDFVRKLPRRLTFTPTADVYPLWTPDGRHVIYGGLADGVAGLFRRNADGTGTVDRLTSDSVQLTVTTISRDGQTLVGHVLSPNGGQAVGLYEMGISERKPKLLSGTASRPANADLSPDGKWIAYQATESNRAEVIVHPYPNIAGGRWQVSTSGGSMPLFSKRGGQLFYRDPQRRLMSVPILPGAEFSHGNPTVVLENVFSPGPGRPFDVSWDDERILLITEARVEQTGGRPPQLNLVFNWASELARLVSTR